MPSDHLERELHALAEAVPFRTGWSVRDLRSGRHWAKSGREPAPAASTRKIAIMMACLAEVTAGTLDLDDRIVLEARHQNNDSGIVRFLRPDLAITLYDALVLMIIVSDNAATSAVVERVGLDAVNALCARLGMTGTWHVASAPPKSYLDAPTPDDLHAINATAPDDTTLLLATIVAGAEGGAASSQLRATPRLCRTALEIMTAQQFRHGLPKLLPVDTIVAHKTGAGPSNESDAGVVYHDNRPAYAIAVYTHHNPIVMPDGRSGRAAARDYIAEMSFCCWKHLT